MKRIIPLTLLLLSVFQAFSQTKLPKPIKSIINNLNPNATHQSNINIIPPNPEAAALGKYGDIPVSLYTGTPSIEIPLYEINRVVKVPINLSYHASGVKVDDISSMVGLGWVLNAGGVITRTIHGSPDDQLGGLQTTEGRTKFNQYRLGQMTASEQFNYEKGVMNGSYDTEPDEYFYNFLGRSGKMVFDENGNIYLTNHEKLKVTYGNDLVFTITDEQGTKYIFSNTEVIEPTTYCFDKNFGFTAWSSWYLTSIEPLNGRPISFLYNTRTDITYTQGLNQTNRYYVTANQYCTDDIQTPCKSVYKSTVKQISRISFDLGTIDFTYEQRGDLGTGWYRLKELEVKNLSDLLIKKIAFTYAYNNVPIGTAVDRYVLQEVSDITDSSIPPIKYKMEYYHFDDLPPRNSNAQDHWGFYNNNSSTTMIPPIPLNRTFTWADREPDTEKSKYGILTKITYPTGGYTTFDYEAHDYGYDKGNLGVNLVQASGGIRIRKITHTDGISPEQVKRYEYRMSDNPSRSSGILVNKPGYYFNFKNTSTVNSQGVVCDFLVASSSSQAYLGSTQGSHIGYEEVTEYEEDGTALNGKTWHKFSSYRDFSDGGTPETFPFAPVTSFDNARGQLKEKKVYRYNGSTFTEVKHTVNTYDYTDFAGVLGLKIMKSENDEISQSHLVQSGSYFYKKLWVPLHETNEYNKEDNGTNDIQTKQTFQYGTNHLQVKEIETKHSVSNRTEITRYTYPLDYNTSGGGLDVNATAIKDMQDKNVVQSVIETQNIIKENGIEKLQNAEVNTYYPTTTLPKENYSFISPTGESTWTNSTISGGIFQKDSHYTKDITYDLYDSYGNLLQLTPKSGVVESYMWSYSSKLPIVKAVGIPYSSLLTLNANAPNFTVESAINSYGQQALSLSEDVKAFVYEPLRGINKVTAPSGISQNFEYDNSGRLKRIKDHDLNLTDWFNYAYASSSPGCTPPNAPSIAVTSSSLCSVDITATGCTGTVNWSNGGIGSVKTVTTTNTITITATCTVSGCTSSASNSVTIPVLSSGWVSGDVGSPSVAGCTLLNGGSLSLQGTGSVGSTSDSFHWIAKQMSGDVTIITKISSMTAADGMRSGIMLRSNTNANAQFYTLIQDGNANVGELKRDTDGGTGGLYSFAPSAVYQTWIKVVKTGNSIKGYYSTDSNPEVNNAWNDYFNLTGNSPTTMNFGSSFYVGLITYYPSGNNTIFTNTTINGNPL